MLHPSVLNEMLDDEIEFAQERLGGRVTSIVRVDQNLVADLGPDLLLVLDGRRFDAEPFRVRFTGREGTDLPLEAWPPGLRHGIHPVLGRPFACVQGTYEYHSHPSHLGDHWALYRNSLRLADLLDHLLRKAGL